MSKNNKPKAPLPKDLKAQWVKAWTFLGELASKPAKLYRDRAHPGWGDGLWPQQRSPCTEGLARVTCRPHSGHPGSRASAQAGTRATGGTTRSLEVVGAWTRQALDGRCLSSQALTLGVWAARGEGPCVAGADGSVLLP